MDWVRFFNDHHVDYVTKGPNTKKGNISIKCPWCGDDDPSHHMGVAIEGENFGCWRGADHSGKNPAKLIAALLGCSFSQAMLILSQYNRPDPETLDQAIAALEGADSPVQRVSASELSLPTDFRRIRAKGTGRRFYQYLEDRGFDDVAELVHLYELCYTTTGRWKDRIIMPVKMDEKLVTWTARAIGKTVDAARYLTLSQDAEYEPPALMNIKDTIFQYDSMMLGGKVLICCEGPFDALKLDYYAQQWDVRSTCVFGTKMTPNQSMVLGEVGENFDRRILLYDPGAQEEMMKAMALLDPYGWEAAWLPDSIEDPGKMTEKQVRKLIEEFL